jgi:HK97 family phage portal protein
MWPFSSLIRDSAAAAEAEQRSAIDFSAFSDLLTPGYAGVPVSEESAVNLPSVYKCVSLNAETISSLPLDVYAKRGDTRVAYTEPPWLRSPNQYQTMAEFVAMTQTSLDLDGNAFWMKAPMANGAIGALYVLAPSAVTVELREGRIVYWVAQNGSGPQAYAASEIVHLRGLTLPGMLRGLSPIACARQTIGIGLAAEQFGAQFFGSGATLSGVIETPNQMTQEQAERLQEAFKKRHGGVSKSHAVGILAGGASWKPLSVAPSEAQFLEARRYTATEVANLYGVPPELVTDSPNAAKGYVTALSMRLRLWYITGLLPRLTRIETAFSGLLPRPAYVRFNRNALLQMDPAERTAFYQAAQLGEWMTRNEIRALEDMNPLPDGDEPLHSVQWQENQPEIEPASEPEEAPALEEAPQ